MGIGQSIDDIQRDFPHVPVSDGSAGISMELNVLTEISVQELSLDEDFLGGKVLEPSVLDLDYVRVLRSRHSIDAVQIKANRGVRNDGLESRFLNRSGSNCRGTCLHT